ncbi:AraC family transcriptional regulator [uncultured Muribaculum sp.]|uniref:helix-turn-helix domain-containing protein n=1 Tax=uncultured Muribaculum sp. TaxID=1918613 RepID=UPI002633CC9A|nr:AraC family transcriptional regulator [uncultured Muribaculum sp.]
MSNAMITVIKPCAELLRYVRYYWVLKSREQFSVLTFPIGCPQIIFHRRSPLFIPELSVSQDKFTISGQANFPAHITSGGDTEMIVAVFYPHTIGMFIGTPPSAFYNSEISGFDIGNKSLNELASRIFDCENTTQSIEIIERWLLAKLKYRHDTLNLKRMGAAVSSLMRNPALQAKELADSVYLSSKQFGRIFNTYVGMMPKEYARIARFQKSMWLLQNHCQDYADIAYCCGYSDQSHFIRDFRQFSGTTPSQITNPYSDLFTTPA